MTVKAKGSKKPFWEERTESMYVCTVSGALLYWNLGTLKY